MPSGIRKYLRPGDGHPTGRPAGGDAAAEAPHVLRVKPDRRELLISRESLRNLAHELRSPLTAIKSSLQLVAAREAGPLTADQDHFLALALRNLDRLDRMTCDLLDKELGRVRGFVVKPRPVDLGPVLQDAARLHAIEAENRGLELDSGGLPPSFTADADPDRIIQIVDNLLGNALKFTAAPGLVHIWLDQHPTVSRGLVGELTTNFQLPLTTFTLVVEDSGRGIALDQQTRLFEAFARAHDETRLHIPGSGLGLHITRNLVGAMGGTLCLASRPGQGTTIWVRLPRDGQSRQLLLKVTGFEARAADYCRVAGAIQMSALDLRGGARVPDGRALAGFMTRMKEQEVCVGTEVVPGLWIAAIGDVSAWERAWSRFAFRAHAGLPENPWLNLGGAKILKPPQVAELV